MIDFADLWWNGWCENVVGRDDFDMVDGKMKQSTKLKMIMILL